jgi:hypothetical protein
MTELMCGVVTVDMGGSTPGREPVPEDSPEEASWGFAGGTRRPLPIDVRGTPDGDQQREAAAMVSRG